jgi:hypothetical protein
MWHRVKQLRDCGSACRYYIGWATQVSMQEDIDGLLLEKMLEGNARLFKEPSTFKAPLDVHQLVEEAIGEAFLLAMQICKYLLQLLSTISGTSARSRVRRPSVRS